MAELAEVALTDSHAPRAVMAIVLWSYPPEPPEANASPSQKSYSPAIALAVSEKVAVPLSAAIHTESHPVKTILKNSMLNC